MKKWAKGINLYNKMAAILLVACFIIASPRDSLAGFVEDDTHITCYEDSELINPTEDAKYKKPIKTYVYGLDVSKADIHQAICESIKTQNSQGTTWRLPTIRVAYMTGGSTQRRDIAAGECTWITGKRFCARTAYPKDGEDNYGNVTGMENFGPPKAQICAYEDPMDGMDTTSGASPYHEMTPAEGIGIGEAAGLGLATGLGVAVLSVVLGGSFGPAGLLLGTALGALTGAIMEDYNHIVILNMGCVDRPMAVGPPVWENDSWAREYLAPPFVYYGETSTFDNPEIKLYFCEQEILGTSDTRSVVCQFRREPDGSFSMDSSNNLIPAVDVDIENVLRLTPHDAFAEVARHSASDSHQRTFEARISSLSPSKICVYNTTGVKDDIVKCLPRPGYMPLPIVTPQSLANPFDAVPTSGIFDLLLNITFPNMPGSVDVLYAGDVVVNPFAVEFDIMEPPPTKCALLHQITFCAEPGPFTLVEDGSGNPTKAEGSLCLKGYDTAPIVIANPYAAIGSYVIDSVGEIVYDPPLDLPNPPEDPKPVRKTELVSYLTDDGLTLAENGHSVNGYNFAANPPNKFVPGGTAFINHAANNEIVNGLLERPEIQLNVGSYHYNPPVIVGPPPQPVQQRPLDFDDVYSQAHINYDIDDAYFGASGDRNGDGPGGGDGIMRPMTPNELGLCAEVEVEITTTSTPVNNDPWTIFPTPEELARVNAPADPNVPGSGTYWDRNQEANESYTPIENCTEVEVEIWGSGAGGTSIETPTAIAITPQITSSTFINGVVQDPPTANSVQFTAVVDGEDYTSQLLPLSGASVTMVNGNYEADGLGGNGLGNTIEPNGSVDHDDDPTTPEVPTVLMQFTNSNDTSKKFVVDTKKASLVIDSSTDTATIESDINQNFSDNPESAAAIVSHLSGFVDGNTTGGAGAYAYAKMNLKKLGLVNKPIPVSVGLGGAYDYIDDVQRVGKNGRRSSFGVNGNMIIAEGGKAGPDPQGGIITKCQNPDQTACKIIQSYTGKRGYAYLEHNKTQCSTQNGGAAWGGLDNQSYMIPPLWHCDTGNDGGETAAIQWDWSLHKRNPRDHGINIDDLVDGDLHYPTNLNFFPNTTSGSSETYGFPGGGGCVKDRCEGICPHWVSICWTSNKHFHAGLVGPGAHGRVKVRCTKFDDIQYNSNIDANNLPTP